MEKNIRQENMILGKPTKMLERVLRLGMFVVCSSIIVYYSSGVFLVSLEQMKSTL